MQTSESIKELATALCKFQGEVEKIKKTDENPFFKSKYASLSSILDVIQKPLSQADLAIVQFPVAECGLETILMHVSGEWMRESFYMKPVKNDPQGIGSLLTYARRYAIGSVLMLNLEEDDDGNHSSGKTPKNESKGLTLTDDTKLMTGTKNGKAWYGRKHSDGKMEWLTQEQYLSFVEKPTEPSPEF